SRVHAGSPIESSRFPWNCWSGTDVIKASMCATKSSFSLIRGNAAPSSRRCKTLNSGFQHPGGYPPPGDSGYRGASVHNQRQLRGVELLLQSGNLRDVDGGFIQRLPRNEDSGSARKQRAADQHGQDGEKEQIVPL